MKSRSVLLILSLLFGFTLIQSAIALADPCDADAKKYCPVYQGKDPRKLYCLQKVSSQVSYACRKEIGKIGGSETEFVAECEADYNRLCAEVVPGEGRIVACLRQHSKEVSFECRKNLVTAP